jgi:integrase
LTHLLPVDDPAQVVERPTGVAVGGVRCDEWFDRWQEAKAARQSKVLRVGKKRNGAKSTAARDRAQWNPWWKPAIGNTLPHVLKESDITHVLKALEARGRSPNYIRTDLIMIEAFLNWLVSEKVISASPLADVSVDVDPVLDRVRDIVVPDFGFLDLLGKRLGDGEDRLVFELLLGTGGRRSEVAGFVERDVDFPASRIWIREPVVEVEGILVRNSTPKGGWHRAVIFGPQLAKMLREHLLRKGSRAPDTEQAVAEATKLCGLTPHHVRHTAAALLWAAGATDIEMQLILGHREIETSKRLYAHVLRGAGVSAAARVEQLREARRASRARDPESVVHALVFDAESPLRKHVLRLQAKCDLSMRRNYDPGVKYPL